MHSQDMKPIGTILSDGQGNARTTYATHTAAAIIRIARQANTRPSSEPLIPLLILKRLSLYALLRINRVYAPLRINTSMRTYSQHLSMIEETEQADTISMTVPLFIRLLEYAREDAKSDEDLHFVAERAAQMGERLDMSFYEKLVSR